MTEVFFQLLYALIDNWWWVIPTAGIVSIPFILCALMINNER